MKIKQPEQVEQPTRDLPKELEAFRVVLDTLKPFDMATRTRIIHATVTFLEISIPRDNY